MDETTLQALADRMALQQLVIDYANAIDAKDYDRLDAVFTPDAQIDYTAMGGIAGDFPKIKSWLKQALANFPEHMHLMGNFSFDIKGDEATGRIACINPMVLSTPDKKITTMIFGLWYEDRYRRTAEGWRITSRTEVYCFEHNMPDWMKKEMGM